LIRQEKVNLFWRSVILFIGSALLYSATGSISYDDWDSVNFALALDEFDLGKHQPHPPGYPVYIFFCKFFYALKGDALYALTVTSHLAGALGVAAFFLAVSTVASFPLAFTSALMLACLPLYWLTAAKPMSDMVGFLGALIGLVFLLGALKNPKRVWCIYALSFVAAFTAGIRLHFLGLLLPALLVALFQMRPVLKGTILRVVLFHIMGALIWIVPVVVSTGSPQRFIALYSDQFSWRMDKPGVSLLGASDIGYDYLAKRFSSFVWFFKTNGLGMDLGAPSWGDSLLFILIVVSVISCVLRNIKSRYVPSLAAGVLVYLAVIFLILPPSNARYLLPLMPVAAFSIAWLISTVKPPWLRSVLMICAIALVFVQSYPLAKILHTEPAPPEAFIEEVNHRDKAGFIIDEGAIDRHLDIVPTKHQLVANEDCETIYQLLKEGKEGYSATRSFKCKELILGVRKLFQRDPRVHRKHNQVPLFTLHFKKDKQPRGGD
jgi:hypothetical protein